MQALGVSPIHQVQISDQGMPLATLRREDLQVEALGYVVENWVTLQGLQQCLADAQGVTWLRPARVVALHSQGQTLQVTLEQDGTSRQVTTQLLVGADGKQSTVRHLAQIPVTGWAYDQVLIVCTITTEHTHHQTGYERFQPSGPFAILPMTPAPAAPGSHRSCIVWTARASEQDTLMSLDDEAFIAAMMSRLSPELGRVLSVSPRFCYAPRRQHANGYVGDRVVLAGDAAHATHPVGGQGFNMGARDVAILASLLTQAHMQGRDLGDPALLRAYQEQRRSDNETVLFGTDTANRLFSNRWPLVQDVRQWVLRGVDLLTPVKQSLIRYAMGLADNHPSGISARLPN